MIEESSVTALIVTRGDVPLDAATKPLRGRFPLEIWNNATAGEDLGVYGRYAAMWEITTPVVLVQDDDVALTDEAVDGLLAAYKPGRITAILPPEYRHRYTDSTMVGFGAIFDRDLPERAFKRFRDYAPLTDEGWFRRTCDVIFTTLTPFTNVDLPFEYLPHTRAPNRMYRAPNHQLERQRMLQLAREVRDA